MSPTPIRDPNAPPDPSELREIPDHQHPAADWVGHPHNPVAPVPPVPPIDGQPPVIDQTPPQVEPPAPDQGPPGQGPGGGGPPGGGKPPGTPGGGPKAEQQPTKKK